MNVYAERVQSLRAAMADRGCDAYLVPGTDPHQSEYVPQAWQRRRWLSGFSGSRGDVAVTAGRAVLWTDSRYTIQAARELDGSGIELFRIGEPRTPHMHEWLALTLSPGQVVGADPALLSADEARDLESVLAPAGVRIMWISENLVDALWADRPLLPATPAWPHAPQHAGESVGDKLGRLRSAMGDARAGSVAVTALDSVAWLFNLRGADIEFNPLLIAYALVTRERARLFVSKAKVSRELASSLAGLADIEPYDAFVPALVEAAASASPVWVDPGASHAVAQAVRGAGRLLLRRLPLVLMKAVKNDAEIAGARRAHLSDGVAAVRFLHWLEGAVGAERVTELSAAARLDSLRARDPLYRGPSFATISSYGPHGAIVHYRPRADTDAELEPRGLYLVDSGGQYLDATTDITRTVALGEPTPESRELFTLALRGVIRLTTVVFPEGTKGIQLDTLARLALWERGLDYGHGTGHGVGSYLCVHEGPQSISPVSGFGAALAQGMVVSIEPGYYREGVLGVRTENLALVVEAPGVARAEAGYLGFETLTLCPIDLRLVEPRLLEPRELAWLNAYHERVRAELAPHLEPETARWLVQATRPL